MSYRASLKVPKYGLFYFEIDHSTSIVPTKNITKVLSGDNKSEGSIVVVRFGKDDLEATIIGVAGMYTKHHRKIVFALPFIHSFKIFLHATTSFN